jgi:cyanophycinase
MKPLYFLADSQLLFWAGDGQGLAGRMRAEIESDDPKAAYVGASNGDQREFYDLFVGAMQSLGISNCRMVPTELAGEDKVFLEQADLVLLAGGDVERGWNAFERNGLKQLITARRYEGCVLVGVSAGAVQLGLGALSEAPQPKKIETFGFAPFYLGAHEEQEEWWNLRALVNLSKSDARGIGISAGGGAIYSPDGTLEPVRHPLIELVKEGDQVREGLLLPMAESGAKEHV